MRVAQRLAGYSLEEADNLRKATGKKIRALIAKERTKFVEGCVANGHTEAFGNDFFDMIEPFADYSFNKSHSFGYGYVTYQTAWLKANYPPEYFAALLTSVKTNKDQTAVFLNECRQMGIEVLVPDVNESVSDFSVRTHPDRRQRHPVRALRGAQRRRGRGRAHRRRARGGRPVHRLLRLLRPRRPVRAQQALRGVTGEGGRVRLARPPAPGSRVRARDRSSRPCSAVAATRPRASSTSSPRSTIPRPSRSSATAPTSPTPSSRSRNDSRSRRRCSGST